MRQDEPRYRDDHDDQPRGEYRPPTVTFLGTLAELTQKEVGGADGATFLGLSIS